MGEPFPNGGITRPQDWLDGLIPKLPNLAEDAIKFEILAVLRDFFKQGKCWRDWIGPITLQPNTVVYSMEGADYKTDIVDILSAYRVSDSLPLRIVDRSDIGADANIFDPGSPSYIVQTPEGMAQIWPPIGEGTAESVRLFVTMMPIDLCVPDWIKIQHYDEIVAGVMSRWLLSPGPNYNFQLGNWYRRMYRDARNAAQLRSAASGTLAPEKAVPPRMGVHGSQRGFGTRTTSSGAW
jgi:hypothetical protein